MDRSNKTLAASTFCLAVLMNCGNTQAADVGSIPYSALGKPNGPALLDTTGKLPTANLSLGTDIGRVFGPLIGWNGTATPGVQVNLGLVLGRGTAGPSDTFDVGVQRSANYVGGINGRVNSAFNVTTRVAAGVRNYEWGGLFQLYNDSVVLDGGENAALYAQAYKNSTGATWGFLSEVIEVSGVDPVQGTIAQENDIQANGGDANGNRVGYDLVTYRHTPSGPAATVTWGYRIQNNNEGAAGTQVRSGFSAAANMPVQYLFDAYYAVSPGGSGQPVTALRMAAGQTIDLVGDRSRTIAYAASGALQYQVGGRTVFQVADGGRVLATQIDLSPDGKATLTYDQPTGRLVYSYNGVRLASWDNAGNMTIKGTMTQAGSP